MGSHVLGPPALESRSQPQNAQDPAVPEAMTEGPADSPGRGTGVGAEHAGRGEDDRAAVFSLVSFQWPWGGAAHNSDGPPSYLTPAEHRQQHPGVLPGRRLAVTSQACSGPSPGSKDTCPGNSVAQEGAVGQRVDLSHTASLSS